MSAEGGGYAWSVNSREHQLTPWSNDPVIDRRTGSAGWMQRAGIESILGLRIEGGALRLDPCIPRSWPRFEMTLRHGASRYEIVVENPQSVQRGVAAAELDGAPIAAPVCVALKDDGEVHRLHVRLG